MYSFSARSRSPVQGLALARPSRILASNGECRRSDVSADNAQRVTSLINAEGGHAVANVADVACIDEVQAAVACAVDAFGDLHFAVNNAGIGWRPEPGRRTGPCRLAPGDRCQPERRVLWPCAIRFPPSCAREAALIVNVSPSFRVVGDLQKRTPHYVAAKHGVTGLTRLAGLAYASKGNPGSIRFIPVCVRPYPGFPWMNRPSQKAVDLHPIGRLGTSDEIAHTVTFCCPEGASLWGTQLIADGSLHGALESEDDETADTPHTLARSHGRRAERTT